MQGVHTTLSDFRWLAAELKNRPTRFYELRPLPQNMNGYHDASDMMCGGLLLMDPTAVPREI